MICILKILYIFEVRNTLNSNDANTGTKTKREQTGASTAVILVHRMGVLRSDSLPLFNQNHFIMRNTNDVNGTVRLIKALHQANRISTQSSLDKRTREELIRDFNIEMDCKNQAYYFILENGHFEAFRDYCFRTRREERMVYEKN